MTGSTTLVACSHGTRAPHARTLVTALVDAVAERHASVAVTEMFVDVQEPALETALPAVAGEVVVLPLFLSGGYHLHHDITGAVSRHPRARLAAPLGPDPLLADVQVQRLRQAGVREGDAVVMAASASSDPRAVRDLTEATALLSDRLGTEATVGLVGGAGVQLRDAVSAARSRADRVVVSSYLLMPGFFHSQVCASGADAVTDPLLKGPPPPELVELVTRRLADSFARQAA